MKIKTLTQTLLVIAFSSAPALGTMPETGLLVVAASSFPDSAIEAELVRDAFLGRPTRSPGARIELKAIDRKDPPNGLRERFYEQVVSRTLTQIKAHWSQIIFTGHGYPPPLAENLAALKKTLQSTPGSISYVSPAEVDKDLKVILKIP